MAKQNINVGASANDKKGDSLRAAFQKVNANFTELYTAIGLNVTPLNLGAFEFTGSVVSTTDSTPIVIDQATTVTSDLTVGGDIVPSVANGGNLGSLAKPFRSLYVSNSTVFLGGVPLSLEPGTNELRVNNIPVSQSITYTDIPNAPTDVADLTDSRGLLGGGGGSGDRLVNGEYEVVLDSDGTLTFPGGNMTIGTLNDSEGIQGSTDTSVGILSQGSGGSSNLQWLDDLEEPTAVAAISVNSPFGEGTGNIQIITGAFDPENPSIEHSWTFGADGTTTFPTGGRISSTKGGTSLDGGLDGGNISLTNYYDNGNYAACVTGYSDGELHITTYNNGGPNPSKDWVFDNTGTLTLPTNGTISYTPDDTDNWDDPAVNTIQAALDELAAKITALQNFEIDGGNAYTPPQGELLIDGNGA
jgi:hypothetical protein